MICTQARVKPDCSATDTSLHRLISNAVSLTGVLSINQIIKELNPLPHIHALTPLKTKQTQIGQLLYELHDQVGPILLCFMRVSETSYVCIVHESNVWHDLSYDVASRIEITPYNKIDKPLVVYRFMGNVMTSITTLRI